jgi:hypothetical protein
METIKEITKWDDGTPNHAYILNDKGKMVAHKPPGKPWIVAKHPLSFSKSRRKFVKLKFPEGIGL